MPRRVSLPGASELFRPTQAGEPELSAPRALPRPDGDRSAVTGRVRHDEKITVYVSSDELLDLERARLLLRAEHGLAVDRGRIVREAIAAALSQLMDAGAESELVRRLS